jgi:hypothetical protein
MRHRIVIALLTLGVIGGYGSGIAHLVHHHHMQTACAGWHGAEPHP